MKPSSCLAELSALDARLPSLRAAFRLTSQGYIFTWSYLGTCDARHTSCASNCSWNFLPGKWRARSGSGELSKCERWKLSIKFLPYVMHGVIPNQRRKIRLTYLLTSKLLKFKNCLPDDEWLITCINSCTWHGILDPADVYPVRVPRCRTHLCFVIRFW